MNDGVLVEALRARDPGALAALYDTYAGSLYRYCRTLLAGPDAAQVALRDTLIAAEALVGSLADPDRFRPWLYALARGECMRRRTPGEEDGPETGPVPVATVPFPGVTAEGAEADLRLVASSAVGALSAEDREVLELAARHGITGQDLAAVLGTGERYAEALLDAATERLRETVTVEILARRATHDCERASAILAGFTGELTPQTRAQLTRHLARCETCGRQRVRQVSPAKVFGLLPQIAMPETLRVRVLSSFIDPELVPYRRYVAKRVGGLNTAGFPRAGRREGRLAQAVAGAVAALAAVATIALVFAQFAGDLREQATDTFAPRRLPTAEAPAGASGGAASPEGSQDEADGVGGRSPVPPVSRDLAEPVEPVV
ncbi:RNA polymerase sigma factor, partial [Microbispora sp. GKU 823]|uniref:RNA polymerase sigma factor n=1 Tax=Microbispora sp. GKU 823 TaxID=1652100 RepID=UPI00117ED98B